MTAPAEPWAVIGAEIEAVLDRVDGDTLASALAFFGDRPGRWFFTGQGRSGLVAQMAAMRLMHLGRPTHVVGEATAPAVTAGDHVVAFSGSGTTPVTLHLAELALGSGADLLVVTGRADSPLGRLATARLLVPAPNTTQFGGSLFEQTSLILFDAVALGLAGPDAYPGMARRHTNLQ